MDTSAPASTMVIEPEESVISIDPPTSFIVIEPELSSISISPDTPVTVSEPELSSTSSAKRLGTLTSRRTLGLSPQPLLSK